MSLDFKPGWCSHCQNTGWIECYCGGDLCICENNGEEPCPYCGGESAYEDDGPYEYDEPDQPVTQTSTLGHEK